MALAVPISASPSPAARASCRGSALRRSAPTRRLPAATTGTAPGGGIGRTAARRPQPVTLPVPGRSDRHILRAVDSEAQTAKEEEEEEEQGAAAAAEGEEGMWGIQPGVEEEWQWERSPDAGRAYAAWASLLLLGWIPFMRNVDGFDQAYFLLLATFTIYIGAHRNLTAKTRQSLTVKEGALAPVIASATLFGGYLLFKFFPNLNIQTLLNSYFALVGTAAVAGNLLWPIRQWAGKEALGADSLKLSVPEGWLLETDGSSITELSIAPSDFLALAVGVGLTYADITHAHMLFPVNNAIATMIVADILSLIGLSSFRTAGVLLVGLLAYDVFWVFGSPAVVGDNVMLAMATSDQLTGPIKLLFPRPGTDVLTEAGFYPFQLLGLGDVALPGLLACLALRYDASRTVDLQGRAMACAAALQDAMKGLPSDASGKQVMDSAADAVDVAYDDLCDREDREKAEGRDKPMKVLRPPCCFSAACVTDELASLELR